MRTRFKWIVAAVAAILVVGGFRSADAAFVGMPSMLGSDPQACISFSNYTLCMPLAYTAFCMRYTGQCKPHQIVFRGGPRSLDRGAVGRSERS